MYRVTLMIDKVQSEIDDILHVCTEWPWW